MLVKNTIHYTIKTVHIKRLRQTNLKKNKIVCFHLFIWRYDFYLLVSCTLSKKVILLTKISCCLHHSVRLSVGSDIVKFLVVVVVSTNHRIISTYILCKCSLFTSLFILFLFHIIFFVFTEKQQQLCLLIYAYIIVKMIVSKCKRLFSK